MSAVPAGGICEFWVVGDHLRGVNVADIGGAAGTAGFVGELGLAERLVVDEECEGFPGARGNDEELVDLDSV